MTKCSYNKDMNVRFVSCPKCAWTSVRKSYKFSWTNTNLIPDDCIKFFIVRDPYDRITSQFKEVILKKGNYGPTVDLTLYHTIIKTISNEEDESKKVELFFENIYKHGFFDSHLQTQVSYINTPRFGRQKIKRKDLIFIDFNNMEEEVNNLLSTDVNLKYYNKGIDFELSIFDDYRYKIEELYREDIELYESVRSKK